MTTTNYTAAVTVADALTDPDEVLDALAGYSAVWASEEPSRARVTLSLDADGLGEATVRAVALVEVAAQSEAIRIEVMTSAEFDSEHGVDAVPA